MKIKFTQEDLDAIETAYYDNEGTIPCNVSYTPKEKDYQILQKLWLRMADRMNKEVSNS